MWPERVSNLGPLAHESDTILTALHGPADLMCTKGLMEPLTKQNTGFSLTPYLESFTPTFGLGTPVFPRIYSNLHYGTPTFSKRCLWDSYFQNPSENPENNWALFLILNTSTAYCIIRIFLKTQFITIQSSRLEGVLKIFQS